HSRQQTPSANARTALQIGSGRQRSLPETRRQSPIALYHDVANANCLHWMETQKNITPLLSPTVGMIGYRVGHRHRRRSNSSLNPLRLRIHESDTNSQ